MFLVTSTPDFPHCFDISTTIIYQNFNLLLVPSFQFAKNRCWSHWLVFCLESVKHANWNRMLRIVCCSSAIWQNRKRKMEMEELSVQQLHHRQEKVENVNISHQRSERKVSIGKRLQDGFVKKVVRIVEQSAKEPLGKSHRLCMSRMNA